VTRTFTSTRSIEIHDMGTAYPYPATLRVHGLRQGRVRDVTLVLRGLSHEWPAEVDLVLAAPNGRSVAVLGGGVGDHPVTNLRLVFDDQAPRRVPTAGPLVSGRYQPTNLGGTTNDCPPPAPPPTGTRLGRFTGLNPNGTWQLYVYDDDSAGRGGRIGSWALTITARVRR
jgi:hypothetical protein